LFAEEILEQIQREIEIDVDLYNSVLDTPGNIIIKVAGYMAYPGGLRA